MQWRSNRRKNGIDGGALLRKTAARNSRRASKRGNAHGAENGNIENDGSNI
jgi:hypothetical protein